MNLTIKIVFGMLLLCTNVYGQFCKVAGNPNTNNILVKLASKSDGTTFAAGIEDSIGVVTKTDTANNLLWSKRIFNEREPYRKYQLTDIGIFRDSMLYGCGIIKVDSILQPLGSFFFIMDQDSGYIHKFKRDESQGNVFKAMTYADDRFYISGGHFYNNKREAKAWCFDANTLQMRWQTNDFSLTYPSYSENSEEVFNAMTDVQNGKFYITGKIKTQASARGEDARPIVVGLDTSGNIILNRYFLMQDNTSELNFFEGVDICFDGPYQLLIAINGQTDYGQKVDNTELHLLKITISGANIFSKKYTTPELSNLRVKDVSVINGRYFLTGTAADDTTAGTLFAMYTNTNGNVTLAKNIRKNNGSMHTNYNYYNVGGGVTYALGHIAIPMSMYFNGPEDSEYYFVRLNDTLYTLSAPCVIVNDLNISDIDYSTYSANLQKQEYPFSSNFFNGIRQKDHEFVTEGCHFSDITFAKEEFGCDSTILTIGSKTGQPHEFFWLGHSFEDSHTFYDDSSFRVKIFNPSRCCSLEIDYTVLLNRNPPKIHLPNDTLICLNDEPYSLDISSSVDFCWGCNLQWNTGENVNDIHVDSSGTYVLQAINNCNKVSDDSVRVKFQRYQQIDPVEDSVICEVEAPYAVGIISPYADSVVWSNNSYGLNTQYQLGELAATEYVISYNECNVVRHDFDIKILDIPVIHNVVDIDSCIDYNSIVHLNYNATNAHQYWVNDLGQENFNLSTTRDTIFELLAENKCGEDRELLSIDLTSIPEFNFQPIIDTCIRENETVTIEVEVLAGNFTWSDGNTNPTRTFDGPGTYDFKVQNQCGSYDESIAISYKAFPREPLLSDIDTCLEEGTRLYLSSNEPEHILWLKNNREEIYLDESISMPVRVSTSCYAYVDTIEIEINRLPEIEIVKYMERCGTTAHVEALDVWTNFPYQVKDDQGEILTGEITESQFVTVFVDERCGYVEDRGYIEMGGAPQIFAPNAFTPDGDAFNNLYQIGGENFVIQSAQIYNRYGQLIFSQEDGFDGWDGSFNGKICPTGSYLIMYQYTSCGEDIQTGQQTFVLLK